MKSLMKQKKVVIYLVCAFLAISFYQPGFCQNKENVKALDTLAIEKVMGMKGKASGCEYKITVPQNDLSIMVDDFKIIPAMGLGTWVAFTPTKDGSMVMGDIIITETDLKPVQ